MRRHALRVAFTFALAFAAGCYGTLHDARLAALDAWQRGDRAAACEAGRALAAAWSEVEGPAREADLLALAAALDATPIPPTASAPTRASALSDLAPVALEADLAARLASDDAADLLPALRAVAGLRLARLGPHVIEVLAARGPTRDRARLTAPGTRAPLARALAREALCALARTPAP
jgi:hypothetical protein